MAIRNILQKNEPLLRKISKPVTEFDEKLWQLLDDMRETMDKADGVGLAGPQVAVLKRVIVINVNNLKLELINPEIISEKGTQISLEGCLSVKGENGYTKRPKVVTISAYDRYGVKYIMTGQDLLAKCFCHEIDHLNGILFIDNLEPAPKKEK